MIPHSSCKLPPLEEGAPAKLSLIHDFVRAILNGNRQFMQFTLRTTVITVEDIESFLMEWIGSSLLSFVSDVYYEADHDDMLNCSAEDVTWMIRSFIAMGADPNKAGRNGKLPLYSTISNSVCDSILFQRELIKGGADIFKEDCYDTSFVDAILTDLEGGGLELITLLIAPWVPDETKLKLIACVRSSAPLNHVFEDHPSDKSSDDNLITLLKET